jgi:hypothetical protein
MLATFGYPDFQVRRVNYTAYALQLLDFPALLHRIVFEVYTDLLDVISFFEMNYAQPSSK